MCTTNVRLNLLAISKNICVLHGGDIAAERYDLFMDIIGFQLI